MRGISNLLVYGLHITAIELTIRWNQFDNIDGVDTSAQTVPLLVSAGILARFLLLHYEGRNDDASAAGGRQPVNPGEGPEQDAGGQNHDQDQADPNAEMVDLDDFVAGIDLDNVSDFFEHGSPNYWLARTAIQRRAAAEMAAARDRLRARGVIPRPARVHSRATTVIVD